MISKETINEVKSLSPRVVYEKFGLDVSNTGLCRCPNPEHPDNTKSACIYEKSERNEYPIVYCFAEGRAFGTIEIYAFLANKNIQKDFKEIISDLQKIAKNENIDLKAAKEEIKEPVLKELDLEKELKNATDIRTYKRKFNNQSYLDAYFAKRRIPFSKIDNLLRENDIEIYHKYENNDNYILYKMKSEDNKDYIVKKDINSYINKPVTDIYPKKSLGNIEPTWLNDNYTEKMVICEGIEDALTVAMQNQDATIVSLNSISQFNKFTKQFKDRYNGQDIVVATDRDKGGQKTMEKLVNFFEEQGIDTKTKVFSYKFFNEQAKDVNEDWVLSVKKYEETNKIEKKKERDLESTKNQIKRKI